jgi:hypothetical protein
MFRMYQATQNRIFTALETVINDIFNLSFILVII